MWELTLQLLEHVARELATAVLTPDFVLGCIGAVLGSLHACAAAIRRGTAGAGILNVLIGVVAGGVAGDVFVEPPTNLLLALPIGMCFGAAGSYILDTVSAMLPTAAANALAAILPAWVGNAVQHANMKTPQEADNDPRETRSSP